MDDLMWKQEQLINQMARLPMERQSPERRV
ncbi:hypothetical protein MPLB_1130054 [Mesorhizobium sp. ORS 3324]|nr:hypothetical protein MPLB_1130054 [Mesorhizobium sp. ORS 3324]